VHHVARNKVAQEWGGNNNAKQLLSDIGWRWSDGRHELGVTCVTNDGLLSGN